MSRSQNGGSGTFNADEGGDYVVPYLHTCWDSLITVQPSPYGPGMMPPMPQGTTYYLPNQLPPGAFFSPGNAGHPPNAGNWMSTGGQFPGIEPVMMPAEMLPHQPSQPVLENGDVLVAPEEEPATCPSMSTQPPEQQQEVSVKSA